MTLDVMAHSLIYWVQELFWANLFGYGSRVFAMTSYGSTHVVPYYGAISAAKSSLESYIRQLAMELAPYGVTANAIRGGVTNTPALQKIPEHEKMVHAAVERNPRCMLAHLNMLRFCGEVLAENGHVFERDVAHVVLGVGARDLDEICALIAVHLDVPECHVTDVSGNLFTHVPIHHGKQPHQASLTPAMNSHVLYKHVFQFHVFSGLEKKRSHREVNDIQVA